MGKKFFGLAVLLLVVTLLISGCWKKRGSQTAVINNTTSDQNQEQNQNQVNDQANEIVNPSGEYTINELLTMNKPLKCTWKESTTDNSDVTNIMYLNGKKFYQDVTMGDIGHAFTISNGEYLYMWNDFTGAASKMKITEAKTSTEPGQEPAKDTAGLEQKKAFICEKWTVDESIFNPPPGKDFKDVTEEMTSAVQDLQDNSEDYKQQACDMCQKAPSQELKNECLKNAQCDQ